ncbi:hypothetical protein [Actinomadura rugatobispora]|uniref:Helix-turn-helix transcriptional regulator n=1 Tax=Actinomadura rugatobispora TaxID=1994 RepID=A0ABW1AGG9_9ACTN|nr:hypothetical protein GCM10010200_025260 [Actinomadura rugatobispora]
MTRAELLRALVATGRRYEPARLHELAAELDLPVSDLFVIAGRPVPAHLLPPDRDREVMREFAYRVTYCDHARLASLEDFVTGLASAAETPDEMEAASDMDGLPRILDGLLRNRGFGAGELPFTGLARSTINGMLSGRWHNLRQLHAMAGPLGWELEDLAPVAGEPLGPFKPCSVLCRHVGRVYVAAIPLTTEQLIQAAIEVDRLSGREDQGAWRPWVENQCPDVPSPG